MRKRNYIPNEDEPLSIVEEQQVLLEFERTTNSEAESELKGKDLKVLSLFSGCGGMDLGFEGGFKVFKKSVNEIQHPEFIDRELNDRELQLTNTRFQTVFANDILTDARNAWVHHFGKRGHKHSSFHTESIVDLVKQQKSGIDVFPEHVDIVTGGFPCQDFSVSGLRNGLNSHKDHKGVLRKDDLASEETRGQLYMWMKQVIEITKPKIFIAENVKGLVNLENIKEIIQIDFSAAADDGYFVFNPRVLHSADYGVPQSRERVIFIGVKKAALKPEVLAQFMAGEVPEALNPYPSPSHRFNNKSEELKPVVTVNDIFNQLPEPEHSEDLSHQFYSKAKFMGRHCQGQTEVKPNGIAPTIRAEHHGNIEYRRLSAENGGKNLDELNLGLPERRLTPRECALIQTFPSDYEFVVKNENSKKKFVISPSKAYKIIGNAVPPLLAYHIAKRLEALWPLYFI